MRARHKKEADEMQERHRKETEAQILELMRTRQTTRQSDPELYIEIAELRVLIGQKRQAIGHLTEALTILKQQNSPKCQEIEDQIGKLKKEVRDSEAPATTTQKIGTTRASAPKAAAPRTAEYSAAASEFEADSAPTRKGPAPIIPMPEPPAEPPRQFGVSPKAPTESGVTCADTTRPPRK